MLRKWDIPDEQTRKRCMDDVLARIDEQNGASFGAIAAQDIIDIVAGYIGPAAYNRAIEDTKKAVREKLADLDIDLDLLRADG